jgi:hypothetical protein
MSKLTMYRGDGTTFPFSAKNADESAFDLTGGTLTFTAKSSARQADVAATMQYTIGSGIAVSDAEGGLFTVTTVEADTLGMYAPAVLVWDVQYRTAGSVPITLVSGTMLVKADVTIT